MSELSIKFLLQQNRIAALDAEVLLAHILKKTRANLFAYPEQNVSPCDAQLFFKAVAACEQGMPVAYLTGEREFWSMNLRITKDTLIPRPETECLIEAVLGAIPAEKALIADCGTGSGAIALALALEKPDWKIYATDIIAAALTIAEENARKLKCKNIIFSQGDWLMALPQKKFHAIVSNPPYLAENDPHLPDLKNEPRGALVAGSTGLEAIIEIIHTAKHFLLPQGLLFIEHGAEQGADVRQRFVQEGYCQVKTLKDYAEHERITFGRFKKPLPPLGRDFKLC